MRRFTLPSADLTAPETAVTGHTFHHMVRVLRLKEGTEVTIADGTGAERRGIIGSIAGETLSIIYTAPPSIPASSAPAITVYQGLPKGDKMEFILQKCTELGVAAIVPFAAARSVRKVRTERMADLVSRWQKITEEAARQSGSRIPAVRFAENLGDAVRGRPADTLKLLLWEEERGATLRETVASLPRQHRVDILVGPEGGITGSEAEEACSHGFIPISLGRNILRTETAGMVVVSILQFLWGDLGG